MANYIEVDTTTKPGWFYVKTNLLCPSKTIYKELYIQIADVKGIRLADDGTSPYQFVEVLCNINSSLYVTADPAATGGYWPIELFNGVAPADNQDLFDKITAQLPATL